MLRRSLRRGRDDKEVALFRRADHVCVAPSRWRDTCGRRAGSAVSEATFYVWKKKYGKLGVSELREVRQLRDENAPLKRLVADLTLDKHFLSDVIRKKV